MKKFLTSICALAVVTVPVWAEDQDQQKPTKNKPPQRQVNNVPKSYTPRVQQQLNARTQAIQNSQNLQRNARTYVPKTNPNFQPKRTPQVVTPPNQDASQANVPSTRVTPTNTDWRNRNRSRNNQNVVTESTTTNSTNRDWRNRNDNNNNTTTNGNWRNNNNNNSNWRNHNSSNVWTYDQARRHHRRDRHDRSWWRSHYSRIALFAGGYYYWNSGYWYPAYGYDPYYSNYTYDEPIYGYNELPPGQVIANVQTALQEQGYYRDAVDGLIGPRTRGALSDFQRDRGLPVTAAIDGPTLQALGLD